MPKDKQFLKSIFNVINLPNNMQQMIKITVIILIIIIVTK